ncbi:hypothetical protein EV426DRAFT_356126 [Tirmania nivea]|nr:hypothetical protein EV426DRAFT_356126 [Tirmania nivea]
MQVNLGLKRWCTKRVPSPPDVSGTTATHKRKRGENSLPTIRSGKSTKDALLRDNSRCVLTNRVEPMVEVAHIFPVAVSPNPAPCLQFMSLLRAFGGVETAGRVAQYLGLEVARESAAVEHPVTASDVRSMSDTSALESSTGVVVVSPVTSILPAAKLPINRLENVMTLSTEAHKLFGNGIIILEPIGDPLTMFDMPINATTTSNPDTMNTTGPLLTSYDILFSYLPSHPSSSEWNLTSFCTPNPLFTLQHTEESDPKLAECELMRNPLPIDGESRAARRGRREFLATGTKLTMTTSDPIRWPLPHPDLLRLHAGLSRVVRCAGGGSTGDHVLGEEDEMVDEVVLGSELSCGDALEESVRDELPLAEGGISAPYSVGLGGDGITHGGVTIPKDWDAGNGTPGTFEKVLRYLSGLPSPGMSSPRKSPPPAKKTRKISTTTTTKAQSDMGEIGAAPIEKGYGQALSLRGMDRGPVQGGRGKKEVNRRMRPRTTIA